MRSILRLPLLAILAAAALSAHAQDGRAYRGRPVAAVLDELRAAGLAVVYSTNLLPSNLLVEAEPSSTEPLALAREILRPHALELREQAGIWLVVRGEPATAPTPAPAKVSVTVRAADGGAVAGVTVHLDPPNGPSAAAADGRASLANLAAGRHVLVVRAAGFLPERVTLNLAVGETQTAEVELVPAAPRLEELTVTASRYDLIKEIQPSSSFFTREDIESLSELGDDTMRVAHRLPGIAANELSARSHVRGGAVDEMSVIFDGIKLIEPFHLRDYQSIFSAVDQRIVSGIQVYSGGFPAEYGDALSGLTVIDQREPTALHQELGLSLLYTSALSSGTFRDGRAQWLVSARRGNIDRLLNEEIGEPSYRDAFVHVATAIGEKHRLAFNSIGFDDDILLTPERSPGESERGSSETDVSQTWVKLDSDWSAALHSRTLVYATHFSAERDGNVNDLSELVGAVDDDRHLHSAGLKQDWRWDGSGRQLLTWGFEAEQLDGSYRYASVGRQLGVLATLGTLEPVRSSSLNPGGESYAAYLSDRVRLTDRLIADLGVRWDRQTYLPPAADDQLSPRLSMLYRIGSRTDFRLSYGQFFQAEGLLDLQVEDGVLEFAPAQSATHSIAGLEHRFDHDLALRVELFRKWTKRARPRYENLFDPIELLPELRPGRVPVSPDRADARGLEVFVSGEHPISWWANYSYSRADDVIGGEHVPRSWDQRNAASAGATWEVGPWSLTAVGTLHSGWPATTLSLATVTDASGVPQTVAVAGPRNAEHLEPMRRLDLRASRELDPKLGTLRFFAELTNATNHENPCCLAYEAQTLPGGAVTLERIERHTLPLTGNVGVLWEF
ncbi:MAG TPA: TonB-dependent receptor [Gammaproteobacteria bacterium]|nr:TonB-dependent receptor [Gammaproteobacteria bacterium]